MTSSGDVGVAGMTVGISGGALLFSSTTSPRVTSTDDEEDGILSLGTMYSVSLTDRTRLGKDPPPTSWSSLGS